MCSAEPRPGAGWWCGGSRQLTIHLWTCRVGKVSVADAELTEHTEVEQPGTGGCGKHEDSAGGQRNWKLAFGLCADLQKVEGTTQPCPEDNLEPKLRPSVFTSWKTVTGPGRDEGTDPT